MRNTSAPRLTVVSLEDRTVPAPLAGVPANAVVVAPDDGGVPVVRVVNPSTGEDVATVQAYEDSFRGGVHAALGDVTGDGVRDLILSPGRGGGPRVRVVDGQTGATVADFFVYEPTYTGGVYVAAADLNGDGKADLVTGTGVGGGPRVRVLDGAALGGRVLADYFAYEDGFRGGVQVAAGDVTGDGRADVITGTGVGGGPRVVAFDNLSSHAVRDFFAFEDSFRGGVQVAAGDTNGDGRAEILAGTGAGGGPVVKAFGADDRVLTSVLADDPGFRGGVRVDAADADGDGRAEIVTRVRHGNDDILRVFAGGTPTDVIVRGVDDHPSAGEDNGGRSDSNSGPGGGIVTPGAFTSVEGTITAVAPAAGTVGLRTAGGATITVRTGPGTKVERNDSETTLAAFQVGDRGEARIGPDGVAVKVEATGAGTTAPPATPSPGPSTAPTPQPPGANARIEGTVTATDPAGGTVTIRTASGTAYLIRPTATTKVERNDRAASLSAFRIGDTGEARTDAAGAVTRLEATGP